MSALGPGGSPDPAAWPYPTALQGLPLGQAVSPCPSNLLFLSPQPQTNSTKNSAAVTSPKGTLPPAALVLSPSAPCFRPSRTPATWWPPVQRPGVKVGSSPALSLVDAWSSSPLCLFGVK